MTILAAVAHPAFVTYVPKRGRNRSTVMARTVTPVAVPEASATEFERPGIVKARSPEAPDVEPWIRGGKAWRPLRLTPERWEAQAPAVTAAELVTWLGGGGEPASRAFRSLTAAFDGTPISLRLERPAYANSALAEHRGGEHSDARVSQILRDDRPAAAAAVAAFVRDEILVVDGIALTRLRPTLRLLSGKSLAEDIVVTREVHRARPAFGLGRDDDVEAYLGRRLPADGRVREAMDLLAGVESEDWDVTAMANALPPAFRAVTEPLARGHRTIHDDIRQACIEADARLLELERLGQRGMIARDAVPAALATMREAGSLTWHAARHNLSGHLHANLVKALAYLDRVALPRLREVDLGADADALGDLAP